MADSRRAGGSLDVRVAESRRVVRAGVTGSGGARSGDGGAKGSSKFSSFLEVFVISRSFHHSLKFSN